MGETPIADGVKWTRLSRSNLLSFLYQIGLTYSSVSEIEIMAVFFGFDNNVLFRHKKNFKY